MADTPTKTLNIINGDITEAPLYQHSKPGFTVKNWMAVLVDAPDSQYRVTRHFIDRSRTPKLGGFYQVTPLLLPGAVVEFGSTLSSTSAAPMKMKWYGVVSKLQLDENRNGSIDLIPVETIADGFESAKVLLAANPALATQSTEQPREELINQKAKEIEKLELQKNAILRRIGVLQAERADLIAEVQTDEGVPEEHFMSATEELFATFRR